MSIKILQSNFNKFSVFEAKQYLALYWNDYYNAEKKSWNTDILVIIYY